MQYYLAIAVCRLSFGFLIHKPFDALFGRFFKLFEVDFYFGYLAEVRQLLIEFCAVALHRFLYVCLRQTMRKGIVKIGVDKCHELVILQYNERLGYVGHIVKFALNLFGIDILSARGE